MAPTRCWVNYIEVIQIARRRSGSSGVISFRIQRPEGVLKINITELPAQQRCCLEGCWSRKRANRQRSKKVEEQYFAYTRKRSLEAS